MRINIIYITLFLLFASGISKANEPEIIEQIVMPNSYQIVVYQIDDQTTFIRYSGQIGYMSGYALDSFITKYHKSLNHIELASPGGNMVEIRDPAKSISKYGIPIKIRAGDACISACAYLALSSKDISIDGLLAFHLPFFSNYSVSDSLYDISQSTVELTIAMVDYLFENEWKMIFYHTVASNSDDRIYVVFDDEKDLNKFRFESESEFLDDLSNHEDGGAYLYRLNQDEINTKLKKQVDNPE